MLLTLAGISATAAVAVGAVALYRRAHRIPDQVEAFGPFAVVTHTISFMAGWNEGQLRRATTERYSVRYRGRPFAVDGPSPRDSEPPRHYERFNSIITFPSPEPAVVVNVGDPNNTSFYYLLRERDGAARVELLTKTSGGGISASLLDPPPREAGTVSSISVRRRHFTGGRWLLLGKRFVLDIETLTPHPIREPPGTSINEFKPPIAMSPDAHGFVRFGYGSAPENLPVMIVFDFTGGAAYALPIDRGRMRFNEWEEIDRAWLDHHFEWQSTPGAHDRLVERVDFTPLPHRGWRRALSPSHREYSLKRVTPAMQEAVIAFIEREFGGERLAPELGNAIPVQFGDRKVYVSRHEDEVGVWVHVGTDSAVIDEVGDRLDAALRTGEYDELFLA